MATANPKTEKTKVRALRVVAKRDGFRRAGRRFGAEPVDIPLADLNRKTNELEMLKADPMLVCHEVDIEVAAGAAAGT